MTPAHLLGLSAARVPHLTAEAPDQELPVKATGETQKGAHSFSQTPLPAGLPLLVRRETSL